MNYGKLGEPRDQAEIIPFKQSFAERRRDSQISTGHDEMIGGLPVELLEQFDGSSFLSLQAIGIHRIEQINRAALDQFAQNPDTAVEISPELTGNGAVVKRLRQFPPGSLAFSNR